MEKKKKRSTDRNENRFNGVIVAYTLKKLQEVTKGKYMIQMRSGTGGA